MEAYILTPDSAPLSRDIADYPEGIIIPIDKPYRWTSADVIRKVKFAAIRHFGKKNLKVGHAGTLDPLATGVLLVCIGKATKLAEELQKHDKEYIAGVTFGATTPSYDLEKDIDRFFPYEHITAEVVADALPAFIGEQDQVAPLFSAKSVDGVRAYELARKLFKTGGGNPADAVSSGDSHSSGDGHSMTGGGISFPDTASTGSVTDEMAKELIRVSRINIMELEMLKFENESLGGGGCQNRATPLAAGGGAHAVGVGGVVLTATTTETTGTKASSRINVTDNSELGLPRAEIRMACSKGTYVRAFARDLGESLGSGAHLDSLQRSRSGIFRVEKALTVDQAIACLSSRPL